MATTQSGKHLVFHTSAAGTPEAFADAGGEWFFAPNNPHGGDGVYSPGYPTEAEALAAAETWEAEQDAEQAL